MADDHGGAQGAGQVVHVEGLHALDGGDAGQPGVGGDDGGLRLAREFDEHLVDAGAGDGGGLEGDFDGGGALELGDGVQAAPPALALGAVGVVGQELQFGDDEAGDDDGGVDQAGLRDLDEAGVDEGGGIQEHGALPAELLGELDVRDDESEIVLGLEDDGDAEIAEGNAQEDLDHGGPGGRQAVALLDQVHEERDHDRGEESDEQAHGDAGDGGDFLGRGEEVEGDEDGGQGGGQADGEVPELDEFAFVGGGIGADDQEADEGDRDHGDAENDAHGADEHGPPAACLGQGVDRLGGVVGWIGHHEECTGGRVGRMLSRPPRGRRPGPVHGWPVNLVRA